MESVNKLMTQQAVDKSQLLRKIEDMQKKHAEDMTEMRKKLVTQNNLNKLLEAKLESQEEKYANVINQLKRKFKH